MMGQGRITRAKAAAEVAEKLHIDEDAVLDLSSSDGPRDVADGVIKMTTPNRRAPLGELAPNSGGSSGTSVMSEGNDDLRGGRPPVTMLVKKKKMGKKTGGKRETGMGMGKEEAPMLETETVESGLHEDEVLESGPSTEMPVEEDSQQASPKCDASLTTQHANAAPASPVEMSHAQLQQQEEGDISRPDSPSHAGHVSLITNLLEEETSVSDNNTTAMPHTMQRSRSPVATTLQQLLSSNDIEDENDVDASIMTKSQYDELEAAVVGGASPPQSLRKSSPHPSNAAFETAVETSIPAISASPSPLPQDDTLNQLDDAVEKIEASSVPEIQPSSLKPKLRKEKPAPAVRTTKASQARMSIVHGQVVKPPAWGRPRQSIVPVGEGGGGKRVISTTGSLKASTGGAVDGATTEVQVKKDTVIIPHSKARPISISFPAPRPPIKSSKPPTKADFSLPGEALSKKFKALREARAAKEAEESKRKVFKARPAPSMVGKTAPAVRQTSTSKARESLIGVGAGRVGSGSSGATAERTGAGGHGRANSVASSRPSVRPNLSSKPVPMAAGTARKSTVPGKGVVVLPKRASTAMGVLNKPSGPLATKPSPAVRAPSGTGTSKGKEVFNRVAQAKSEEERAKRAKEEGAKAARVAAAERSRALSREWAEKQRLRKKEGRISSSGAV